jgi:hypothetical protein
VKSESIFKQHFGRFKFVALPDLESEQKLSILLYKFENIPINEELMEYVTFYALKNDESISLGVKYVLGDVGAGNFILSASINDSLGIVFENL